MKKQFLMYRSFSELFKLMFAGMMLYAIILITTSCKKDDKIVKPVESAPINETFFVNSPVNIIANGSGNFEYGFKFSVTQKGKINKLASRMPQAGSYRITLWDASVTPQTVLATANINQTAGALTFQPITPVSLETGKDYFVSVWSSGQWYEIRPIGGGSFTYPMSNGSVVIKGYQWISSGATPQTFPSTNSTSYVAGLADFEFQPD